ncbi:MAG: 3-phosphoshikimate 1-carboxyvinyltransferase [Candidatus Lokiarchaeota archaeon]|nr:3-phosphoshikimate 1-carboxyvinyltransferase [Candidatus Lokiarchaeota archaeon]
MKLKIIPTTKLQGEVIAPPSKSYSHRAFIASSLAKGVSIIKNPLISGDVEVTIDIIRALGHRISRVSEDTYIVKSTGGSIKPIKNVLDCKNSGTSLRIFCALAMLIDGGLSFSGEFLKRKRPIIPLLNALKSIGGSYDLSEDFLTIKRKGKECNTIEIPGNKSSQFVSALLMMCPLLNCKKTNSITIKITSPIVSYPYVKITLNVLDSFGINIQEILDDKKVGKYVITCGQNYRAQTFDIPGDFSSTSFIIAAAILSPEDSLIVVRNLNFDKPQGDRKIIEVLQRMGAKIEVFKDNNSISIKGNINKYPLTGLAVDIEDTPDLFPILSVVGAFAKGKTEIYNASSIRGKESDRLSLMAQGLSKMGVKVKEEEDKLIIYHCDQLEGIDISHENDHRVAMAFTIASLFAKTPSQLSDIEVVKDSYPNFIEDIKNLGAIFEKIE